MEKLYAKLPIFLQNLACTVYGYKEKRLRFNDAFEKQLQEYQELEKRTLNQKLAQEKKTLRELLKHSQEHIPYYTRVMKDCDFNVEAEDIYEELKKLPILTKELLRKHNDELVATNIDKATLLEMHTSGTTGKALTLYRDKESVAKQWALCYRHRGWYGCKFGDEHVNFTGKLVVPTAQTRPPFWRKNAAFNQHLVNMQHINEDNIEVIVEFLNSVKPKFYSGYPSIIAEVARLALEKGLVLNDNAKPSVVFAGAENTLDYQRDDITAWTGAPVTDLYGLTEGNSHMSRCEHGNYHVDHEYGYVEAVEPEELEDGRVKGKLVATGFSSLGMPLIRYDTGDMAIWAPENFECGCGRQSRVIESIEGRIDDFVELNDGRRIMRFDYLFKGTDDIKEAQVCQFKKGEVVFKLVIRGEDKSAIESELLAQFKKWIATDMDVHFEYVDRIPRSNTGKFKAVQSFL